MASKQKTTRQEQPAASAAPRRRSGAETPASDGVADAQESLSPEARRILQLKVPVIVKLADKLLPLGDIIDLTPGSIVEFAHRADQSLDLLVNDKVIGHGVAVKVGEKFGLQIEEIQPVQEKIRSLGI